MFDFPNTPTTGQVITGPGGIQFQWDGVKWVVINAGSPGFAPINSPQFSGDPQVPTAAYGDNDNSVSDTAFVQNAVTPLTHNVGRNFFHNGLFNIWQRGVGPWTSGSYTADRWQVANNTDTISFSQVALTDAQRAQIGDESAYWGFQNTFTGNSAASAFNEVIHKVESVPRLSGKTVTVSFFAVSPQNLRLGLNGYQQFGTGGSPSPALSFQTTGNSVQLSSTWARYQTTFNIPSMAGKTLGTNGDSNTVFQFFYSSGATNAASAGNIGVQSGTVTLWGMQLEIGSQATPLEKIDPQIDLMNCMRFYQGNVYFQYTYPFNPANAGWTYAQSLRLSPRMRVAPSASFLSITLTNCNQQVINAQADSAVFGATAINTTGGFGMYGTAAFSADL